MEAAFKENTTLFQSCGSSSWFFGQKCITTRNQASLPKSDKASVLSSAGRAHDAHITHENHDSQHILLRLHFAYQLLL